MISIIICSRESHYLRQVTENITATIGVPFEIQAIDNSRGEYGICEAYNLGAGRSRFGILCFVHEDVKFATPDWGQRVADTLKDPAIGLIGIAGGQAKTRNPEGWWTPSGNSFHNEFCRCNLIQGFSDQRPSFLNHVNPGKESISDVVALDGVWFCCRREVWEQNKFDSRTFTGFHFYDLDFSMQVFQRGYRVCVVYDVLLEHFSSGSVNEPWVKNAVKFARKWRNKLPVSVYTFDDYKWRRLELASCKVFIQTLLDLNIKNGILFRAILKYLLSDARGWTTKKILKEKVRAAVPWVWPIEKSYERKEGKLP